MKEKHPKIYIRPQDIRVEVLLKMPDSVCGWTTIEVWVKQVHFPDDPSVEVDHTITGERYIIPGEGFRLERLQGRGRT